MVLFRISEAISEPWFVKTFLGENAPRFCSQILLLDSAWLSTHSSFNYLPLPLLLTLCCEVTSYHCEAHPQLHYVVKSQIIIVKLTHSYTMLWSHKLSLWSSPTVTLCCEVVSVKLTHSYTMLWSHKLSLWSSLMVMLQVVRLTYIYVTSVRFTHTWVIIVSEYGKPLQARRQGGSREFARTPLLSSLRYCPISFKLIIQHTNQLAYFMERNIECSIAECLHSFPSAFEYPSIPVVQ